MRKERKNSKIYGLIDISTGIVEAYIRPQDLISDCEELTTEDKIYSLVDAAITDGILENSEYVYELFKGSDIEGAKRL